MPYNWTKCGTVQQHIPVIIARTSLYMKAMREVKRMWKYKYGIVSFIITYLLIGYMHVKSIAFSWALGTTQWDRIVTYITTALFEGVLIKIFISLIIAVAVNYAISKVKKLKAAE